MTTFYKNRGGSLKLKRHPLLLIIAAVIVFVLPAVSLTGCGEKGSNGDEIGIIQIGGTDTAETDSNDESTPNPGETDSAQNPDETDGMPDQAETGGGDVTENPANGAFPPIPLEEYPRGTWTINKFSDKYGPPEAAEGLITNNMLSMTFAVYTNLKFHFNGRDAVDFSFGKKPVVGEYYPLTGKDKDLKLETLCVTITGEDVELPHDIKIGTSTKAQVIEAYGKPPWAESDENDPKISFVYYSFGKLNDDISYFFSLENDVLEKVVISLLG